MFCTFGRKHLTQTWMEYQLKMLQRKLFCTLLYTWSYPLFAVRSFIGQFKASRSLRNSILSQSLYLGKNRPFCWVDFWSRMPTPLPYVWDDAREAVCSSKNLLFMVFRIEINWRNHGTPTSSFMHLSQTIQNRALEEKSILIPSPSFVTILKSLKIFQSDYSIYSQHTFLIIQVIPWALSC